MKNLNYIVLPKTEYQAAWDLQKEIHIFVNRKLLDDTLILLEHPHTYTLGKAANNENLLLNNVQLEEKKIKVFNIDRGGDITYHGPGQLVGYPIINLNDWFLDAHKYLRAIEEVIILVLQDYGIIGIRDSKYTGVWIEHRKITAIGVKLSKWITMHGFAFNINTDLSYFNGIIPCGISDKEVTSLEKELGKEVPFSEVIIKITKYFKEVFNYTTLSEMSIEELNQILYKPEII